MSVQKELVQIIVDAVIKDSKEKEKEKGPSRTNDKFTINAKYDEDIQTRIETYLSNNNNNNKPRSDSSSQELSSQFRDACRTLSVEKLAKIIPYVHTLAMADALPRTFTRTWAWPRLWKPLLSQHSISRTLSTHLRGLVAWAWESDDGTALAAGVSGSSNGVSMEVSNNSGSGPGTNSTTSATATTATANTSSSNSTVTTSQGHTTADSGNFNETSTTIGTSASASASILASTTTTTTTNTNTGLVSTPSASTDPNNVTTDAPTMSSLTTSRPTPYWGPIESDVLCSAITRTASTGLVASAMAVVRARPRAFFIHLRDALPQNPALRVSLLSFLNRFLRLHPSLAHHVASTQLLLILIHIPLLDTDLTAASLALSTLSIVLPRVPSALDPYLPAIFSAYLCSVLTLSDFSRSSLYHQQQKFQQPQSHHQQQNTNISTTLASASASASLNTQSQSSTSFSTPNSIRKFNTEICDPTLVNLLASFVPQHQPPQSATSPTSTSQPTSQPTSPITSALGFDNPDMDAKGLAMSININSDLYPSFPTALEAPQQPVTDNLAPSAQTSTPMNNNNSRSGTASTPPLPSTKDATLSTQEVSSPHTRAMGLSNFSQSSINYIENAVRSYFTILYGLFPCCFASFLRKPSLWVSPESPSILLNHSNPNPPQPVPLLIPDFVLQNDTEADIWRHVSFHFSLHTFHSNFIKYSDPTQELADKARWLRAEAADVVADCEALVIANALPTFEATHNQSMSSPLSSFSVPAQATTTTTAMTASTFTTAENNIFRPKQPSSLHTSLPPTPCNNSPTLSPSQSDASRRHSSPERPPQPGTTAGGRTTPQSMASDMSPIPSPTPNGPPYVDIPGFSTLSAHQVAKSALEESRSKFADQESLGSASLISKPSRLDEFNKHKESKSSNTSSPTSQAMATTTAAATSSPVFPPYFPPRKASSSITRPSPFSNFTNAPNLSSIASPELSNLPLPPSQSQSQFQPQNQQSSRSSRLGSGQVSPVSTSTPTNMTPPTARPSISSASVMPATATPVKIPLTPEHVPRHRSGQQRDELIESLEREINLLRDSLNYEQYLRAQHNQHLGTLHREHIYQAGAEAERQALNMQLRTLKDQYTKALQTVDKLRSEAQTAKQMHVKWENELQKKLKIFREERRNWNEKKEILQAELASINSISIEQEAKLAEADSTIFALEAQAATNAPKLDNLRMLEERVEELQKTFLEWDEDWSKHQEQEEQMMVLVSELKKTQLHRETIERDLTKALETQRNKDDKIDELNGIVNRLRSKVSSLENVFQSRQSAPGKENQQQEEIIDRGNNVPSLDDYKKAYSKRAVSYIRDYESLENRYRDARTAATELQEQVLDLEAQIQQFEQQQQQQQQQQQDEISGDTL